MNQSTPKPEPEQPRMTTEEFEARLRDFFSERLLPRLEDTDEDELVGEGVIIFAREAPRSFLLNEETAEEGWKILHACVAEQEPLALPGLPPRKPKVKRKTVLQPDSLLRVQQVMDRLQVSENSVYGMVKRGELRAILLGARMLRIFPDSVEIYITSATLRSPGLTSKFTSLPSAAPQTSRKKR